jgi:DNA-binding winged helix-turn-helix (wHTH) protein
MRERHPGCRFAHPGYARRLHPSRRRAKSWLLRIRCEIDSPSELNAFASTRPDRSRACHPISLPRSGWRVARWPVNLGLARAAKSVIARYLRRIARGTQIVRLRVTSPLPGIALAKAHEVIMRTSGSTAAFGRLAQFPPEPALDLKRAIQSQDAGRPRFEKPTGPAVRPPDLSFGPFRLLSTQFLLLEGDKPVPLGSRALEILIALLERRGELVSRQELVARVWPNVFVEPITLRVHISALRRALRDGRNGTRFIVNIHGRGYCFVSSVGVSGHEN